LTNFFILSIHNAQVFIVKQHLVSVQLVLKPAIKMLRLLRRKFPYEDKVSNFSLSVHLNLGMEKVKSSMV
jgi:hypothetical protein